MERLIFLACNIYSILAEYSLHSCTYRWVLWPMGLWLFYCLLSNFYWVSMQPFSELSPLSSAAAAFPSSLSLFEPQHDKINKMTYAPSEDSDRPGHLPSLIRVFAVGMKKAWVLSYQLSTQQRFWSDWADAQADLRLRWVHSHFIGFIMWWLILFYVSDVAFSDGTTGDYLFLGNFVYTVSDANLFNNNWAPPSEFVSSGVCDQVTFKPTCSATETARILKFRI